MAKQDLKELGFNADSRQQAAAQMSNAASNTDRQKQGFIAGMQQ